MIDFKSIFNLKAVVPAVSTEWLNTLSELEDIEALKVSIKHLSNSLEAVQQDDLTATHLKAHLDLIISLEELNQARLARLSKQFSSIESLKPELEKAMKATCYDYCRLSYICHLKIIDKVIDPTQFKLEGNLPVLIIARAFYIAFNMMKWRMFEHASSPPNSWLQLYALYGIAQKQMLHTIPIEVFKLSPASTINDFLVQICMFGQLSDSHLPKHCIEMAGQVLNALLTRVQVNTQHLSHQHTFYINLNKDKPATRVREVDLSKSCLYWELQSLEKEIIIGMRATEQGDIPHKLALTKIDNGKKLHETLKILNQEWSKQNQARQRRKESRKNSSRKAHVSTGFASICEQIFKATQYSQGLGANSLDERLRHHTVIRQAGNETELDPKTTWLVLDESAHGIGARINTNDHSIGKPDKLISLCFHDEPNKVLIGKIRTSRPVTSNQLNVGIEILSQRPIWAQLRPLSSPLAFSQPADHAIEHKSKILGHGTIDIGLFSGIYLPIEAGYIEQSALLLPKLNFRPNTEYEINAKGVSAKMQLGNAIESYDDWVKVLVNFG
jgi:hypothetical protein